MGYLVEEAECKPKYIFREATQNLHSNKANNKYVLFRKPSLFGLPVITMKHCQSTIVPVYPHLALWRHYVHRTSALYTDG